jgi:hypothetical protein
MLQPVVDMFAKFAPGNEPMVVFDSSKKKEVQKWVVCACLTNDIRGVPNATCGKSPPCLVGSCNMCTVGGHYHRASTVVPGALWALDQTRESDKDLMTSYKREFKHTYEGGVPTNELGEEGPPRKRTKKQAVDAGNRVLTAKSAEKEEAYKDVDIYTTSLWYHDKIAHTMYDLAHQFGNVIKQMLNYIRNTNKKGKVKFSPEVRTYETEKLKRFTGLQADLRPKNERGKDPKYPPAPWVASKPVQNAIDDMLQNLKLPSCYPGVRSVFADLGFMKTAETLLLAGDAGAYILSLLDIQEDYRDLFIEILRLIERCMRKVSTPGDRAYLLEWIPVVMTKLELLMPIDWNTIVVHIFTHHTVDIIMALGPFNAANILDIERFHTLFKSLARGKENVMASIKNHYLLLEVALSARMNEDIDWTTLPAKSTPAGYAGRLDSEDKDDRMCQPFGAATNGTLLADELKQVQTLWADSYPVYFNLHKRYNAWARKQKYGVKNKHFQTVETWTPSARQITAGMQPLSTEEKAWQAMTNDTKDYKKVQFAGNFFKTRKSEKYLKTDDSNIGTDYRQAGPRGQTSVLKAYASIKRMFIHAAYPGGPSRVIVEGEWYRDMGKCPVAKTTLVKRDKHHNFNLSARFMFLEDCYRRPVALWPFDPLHRLESEDPKTKWFHVIDRNQEEIQDA